jgi:hypothetical protein
MLTCRQHAGPPLAQLVLGIVLLFQHLHAVCTFLVGPICLWVLGGMRICIAGPLYALLQLLLRTYQTAA